MNNKILLRIAGQTRPFTAVGGRAFVTVPAQSLGRLTLPVRSRAFRQWFFDRCYSEYDAIPSTHAFNAILHHLEAQAARDPDTCNIRVPYRVDSRGPAAAPAKILLDLANPSGEFVEISPSGFQVSNAAGVPFETSPSTQPLPTPEPPTPTDTPLDTLRTTLNLGPPNSPDFLRCLAWLLTALRPSGPYPILILRGPSGSGKSVAARALRALIDPSSAPATPIPATPRELLTLARHNWVLAFDHVSTLTPALADSLCRLSSGAGIAFREPGLPEPFQLPLKRPILLTVTDRFVPPPDLAARALIVTLPDLTPDTRLPEYELAQTLGAAHPKILGALCAAISQVLACPPPSAPSPTRHAATLAWALAAAPAWGCTPAEIHAAFDSQPSPDPLVDAVRPLLNPKWTGTACDLLQILPLAPNPQALARRLRKSHLSLADAGIDLTFQRLSGGIRTLTLIASQNPEQSPQPAPSEAVSPPSESQAEPSNCVTSRLRPLPVEQSVSEQLNYT